MKSISKLFAGLLAFGVIGAASAQTVITITGSTAFRGSAHQGILDLMTGESYAYTGSDLNGARYAIFTGNVPNVPGTVTVKTSWSGSITGIVSVRNSTNVPTLPNSTTQSPSGNGGLNENLATENSVPDLSFSDVSQTSTPFSTTALQERPVGIIPFQVVASNSAPANLTNMTSQLMRQLFSNGFIPIAMATGSPADRTTLVNSTFGNTPQGGGGPQPFRLFALGRNAGSGTRFITLAEPGIGVNSSIQQWDPSQNLTATTVTNHRLWPAETVNGIFYSEGNSGYSSGSQLRGVMRLSTTAGLGGAYITVLGVDDAADVAAPTGGGNGPGKTLTYNGVAYSATKVQEGQYSFWAFQQLINRQPLSGPLGIFVNGLVPLIRSSDPIYNALQVDRANDGSTIFPLY
ncbi:MAG: hypothetical protein WA771_08240 [Chthoniobacterales bacterium]